jgi:agarase
MKKILGMGIIATVSMLSLAILQGCGGNGGASTVDKTPETNTPTKDTTPQAFTFTDITNVNVTSSVESNTITVTSINEAVAVSISGGEYKIDDGEYTSSTGTVTNGQKITIKATSANEAETKVDVILTVGGISDTFSITTLATTLTVDVNLNMKHQTGNSSSFDRSKFITLHASLDDREWPSDEVRDKFFKDYDVYLGRNNGGLPWFLSKLEDTAVDGKISMAAAQEQGQVVKNNYKNAYLADPDNLKALEDRSANMMQGGQMVMYPLGEQGLACNVSPCNSNDWLAGYEALGEYFSAYLTHYFGTGGESGQPKPKLIEVVNEPFYSAAKHQTTAENISKMHAVVANKINEAHPDVLVGGYTAAWPGLEIDNFDYFRKTWKTFIDNAGKESGFYSVHIYDDFRDNKVQYRSGANMEAILDLIDQYSIIKIGERKPWAISELGYFSPTLSHHQPYTKERDWWNIRSFSSMTLSLMDKPDQVIYSMPFVILKGLWLGPNGLDPEGNRYGSRLFILEDELDGSVNVQDNGKWIYSDYVLWFDLWSEVKGTRIDTTSNDLDVQVDSYIDGNDAYLIINNLDTKTPATTALNIVDQDNTQIESITVKHLYFDETTKAAILDKSTLANDVKSYTVDTESTAIIKITYANDVTIDQTSLETKYYSDKHLQPITANNNINFNINNVDATSTHGEAVIRIGVGREHSKSLNPAVTINGKTVSVIEDIRGHDLKTRPEFFGVLEVPVSYDLLESDNVISVTFPDSGGNVSSVTMQVFNMTDQAARTPR